jgi:hypothetical protein
MNLNIENKTSFGKKLFGRFKSNFCKQFISVKKTMLRLIGFTRHIIKASNFVPFGYYNV